MTEIIVSTFQLKSVEGNDKQKLWFTRYEFDISRYCLIDGQWQRQIQSNFPSFYPILFTTKQLIPITCTPTNEYNFGIWLILPFVKRFVEYKRTQFDWFRCSIGELKYEFCMECLLLLLCIWSFNPLLEITKKKSWCKC